MAARKKLIPDEAGLPRRTAASRKWRLSEYFPYHLSFTSELMSMEQSRVLHEATGLTMSEWRVMSVLGSFQPLSTNMVVSYTTMNKVAVSRAVSSLVERGYIERGVNEEDGRLLRLEFSESGRVAFKKMAALVSTWSASLLETLTAEELRLFKRLLGKLRIRMREMSPVDWPLKDEQLFDEG
jgi:DNA-binding MarR family transcriptional regulator